MMSALTALWAAATVALVGMLIYRALLSNKEEDALFLGEGEEHLQQEQQVLQKKIISLGRYSMYIGALSGVLLLTIMCLWTYEMFTRPPIA